MRPGHRVVKLRDEVVPQGSELDELALYLELDFASSTQFWSFFSDLIEDEFSAQPDERTAIEHRTGELAAALARLAPRMQRVLVLRFGLDGHEAHTLGEASDRLGVARERVRQLERTGLNHLKRILLSPRHGRA